MISPKSGKNRKPPANVHEMIFTGIALTSPIASQARPICEHIIARMKELVDLFVSEVVA